MDLGSWHASSSTAVQGQGQSSRSCEEKCSKVVGVMSSEGFFQSCDLETKVSGIERIQLQFLKVGLGLEVRDQDQDQALIQCKIM